LKILIDIGHPAHVHFFKNFIWEMKKGRHELVVTSRDKDVALSLLKAYGIEHTVIGKAGEGKFNLIREWIGRDWGVYSIARRFHPDILIGVHNPSVTHVARLTGGKSIIFTDTEHTKLADLATYPFADVICTPFCFKDDLGKKQIRYNGYHELAYLHPDYFIPDRSVLTELGLSENDRYVLVRFVSWSAAHYFNIRGLSNKKKLVERLGEQAQVIISSEREVSDDLGKYVMKLSPEKLHSVLYYASLCVGDGGATAVEAALLGTPSILIETYTSKSGENLDATQYGVLDELISKYRLLHAFCDQGEAVDKALEFLQDGNTKKNLQNRKERLLSEKMDVTKFMVNLVENYPESLQTHENEGV